MLRIRMFAMDLIVAIVWTGDKPNLRPFQILSSVGVTIRNSLFSGGLKRGGSVIDALSTGFNLAPLDDDYRL